MLFAFCSCAYSQFTQCAIAHLDRVPIYSAASWASLVSITAASYVEPFRDVYEVKQSLPSLCPILTIPGLHYLHLPPAVDQLHRRRTRPHHPNDRSRTCATPLAAESRLRQNRYLGSAYLPCCKARHSAVRMGQAGPLGGHHRHEGDRHIQGGLY